MSFRDPRQIDRRRFLVVIGGTALASTLWPTPAASAITPMRSSAALRSITYNVLACRGYPSTDDNRAILRNARKQMPARIALELALHQPDIVTFQESPAESIVADIANRMGMNHAYFRGGFPGAVISRFKIMETTNKPLAPGTGPDDIKGLFTRHWGRAVLKTEDGDLVVYSAHMFPGDRVDIRAKEVTQMLSAMKADLESDRSMILQGDLNHTPDGPEYQRWVEAGLRDAFASRGAGDGFSIPSTEPRVRIDYVWAHGPLADRLTECRVLFEGAFRTNPHDLKSFALSDHIPVLAVFG